MDLQNNIQSWNAGAAKVFGYRADEIVGKNITMLLPPGHKNDIPQILQKLANSKDVKKFESLNMQKDGTVIPVSLAVSLTRDANGEVIGSSRIAHNITERKRSEAEREAIIECLGFINVKAAIPSIVYGSLGDRSSGSIKKRAQHIKNIAFP